MKLSLFKPCNSHRPTWLGWLLILAILLGSASLFLRTLYPFLAPNNPIPHGILALEGWMHDRALEQTVEIYRTGHYSKIACTGVPIETGSYLIAFKSYPEMTAARLQKLGIPASEILVAIGELSDRDRTYAAGIGLRDTLLESQITETNIHLVSVGPHGRRSRLLFRKALGNSYQVGITSLEDVGYDPQHWYAYSDGFRKTIDEWIAYGYALFFHP